MALASTTTTALDGVAARMVTVEANIGPGLPGMFVVGLGDAAVRESRDRIRTAVANSSLDWPKTKIIVSLSPADLPKAGSHFDLPIALSLLAARHPFAARRLAGTLVLGELGLDGSVRPVTGVLPALLTAAERRSGVATVIIPAGNAAEAQLLSGLRVLIAESLAQVWSWAIGDTELPSAGQGSGFENASPGTGLDFADIAGQPEARRAAEIAAAGGHHLLMIGPPGSGKSMIAERLPSILPPLTPTQAIEATAVHSVAGALLGQDPAVRQAPFVAPHHSVTRAALLGGGSGHPRPGAVSLAHHGVLFLDEASEIPARVLDSLRTPLEHGRIKIVRARREVTFPARFQLVLAANPCLCGADEPANCECTAAQRGAYLSNLSGPLLDRLDMNVRLGLSGAVLHAEGEETSAQIAQRVAAARERAWQRWGRAGLQALSNAEVEGAHLRRHAPADEAGMALISAYLADGSISQRGVDKTLRLAWTICDLAQGARPDIDHVAQALQLRAGVSAGMGMAS